MQGGFRAHAIRAVIGCATALLGHAGAGDAAAVTWSIERTPNPPGAQASALAGVSCAAPAACMAVGHFTTRAGAGAPLAERWNGANWSIAAPRPPAASATSLLFDVSCPSITVCVAVGSTTKATGGTTPLAERWNGSGWAIEQPPSPRTFPGAIRYLGAVSCSSTTDCAAVGAAGNGSGTRGAVLVEHWNGRRWTIERTPRVGGAIASFLSGVSCASARSCTAVGFANRADGAAVPLAEHWNGSTWAAQPTPDPAAATSARLSGVSCGSSTSCIAVGSFTIVTGIEIMLAEHWDGRRWTSERTRYPAGARFVQLSGVSCTSPVLCTAVGSFNNVAGIDVTLAEARRDREWTVVRTPNPRGSASGSLAGISCRSSSACVAVGEFTGRDGIGMTLAERSSTQRSR